MGSAWLCPAATAHHRRDGVGTTPVGIPNNHRRRRKESGWKRPTRGEEEDVMATSAECDGDGQLGGRSVAVVAAFAVVIVRRPPQGPSSHWQEATSEEEEDNGDERR